MTEGESNRADVVDIDELVISMKRELNYYWSLGERLDGETELCLIYKVPQHIRMIDRIAYEPIVQSIGPYHHGTPALQAMEKEKWNCLDYILKLNPEKTLRDYLMVMWELENQAKSCYLEEIKMENKKFLRMLLLDGCFILVSLYGTNGIGVPMPIEYVPSGNPQEDIEESRLGQKRASWENTKNEATRIENKTAQSRHLTENLVLASEQSKPSTSRQSMQHDKPVYEDDFDQVGPWYTNFLAHDLLLLENQIPFFVVKRVYELVAGKDTSILLNNIVKFLEGIIHFYPRSIQESERPKDFYHLLHLCHMYFRPSKKMEEGHHYQARRRYFNYFLQMGCKFLKLGLQSDENVQNSSLNPQSDFLKASQHCWRRAVQYHEAGVEFRRKEFDKNNPFSVGFMAAVVVQICFRDFLRIVYQQFSVSAPVCEIPMENEGLLSVYVEVEVPKGETVSEAIRCWGMSCSTVDETEEDAACRAVAKLRDEFGFEVKDSNLEKKKFFENLYERISTDYSSLRGKYKRLKCDYNLLKGYYSSLLAEKEQLLSDWREFKENLVMCLSLVKCPKTAVVRPYSSEGVSEEDPAAPPSYYGSGN
uniref:Uncharacterized protein n=1 Tax=Ananas comosus var. bracteatus TaxID=296719 RepID=A0A6V7PVJ1_ANACO|nr:unnamed protein product [Ananas comosus var. bracteatus]